MHLCFDFFFFITCLIRSEFAVHKLKKSGFKGGAFLVRQSPKNYDNFFLTVCAQVKVADNRHVNIRLKNTKKTKF